MRSDIYTQLAALQIFREKLVDGESKELLDSYVESLLRGEHDGREYFQSTIYDRIWGYDMHPDYDFDQFMKDRNKNKIIIFGAGHDGKLVKRMLEKTGMSPRFFCDNKVDGEIDGLEVISPELLRSNYRDHVVILASRKYGGIFLEQLLHLFFPQENIYYPRDGILRVNVGWQYFGIPYFKNSPDEVFLDCGCLDGSTVFDFIKWCNGNYRKIYSFEPDKENFVKSKGNLSGLERVELQNVGLWNETSILQFSDGKEGASRISPDGQAEIKVIRIDDILKGKPATFIKMDIEGAELNALQGAKSTIKTYHPKLAISVYHKWTDLMEIPTVLMSIAPEYRYAIRHHTSMFGEMVLYAWI